MSQDRVRREGDGAYRGKERRTGHRGVRKPTEEDSFYLGLIVNDKTMKLLEENKGNYLHDLG